MFPPTFISHSTLPRIRSPHPNSHSPHPLICSLPPPSKTLPALAYTAYMSHLFLLSPTGPPTPLHSLSEALQLSLNFAYITPLTFPTLAPTLHPLLESLFHLIVAWALLLLAFVSEDLHPHPNSAPRKTPATPFLLATPFLTNIFYLPYLILRTPPSTTLRAVPSHLRSGLQTFADSPVLPIVSAALVLASIPWGLWARPEFGGITERWASFVPLLTTDLLAHSFAVDVAVFTVFQGWLVNDDAKRREWQGDWQRLATAACILPFVGLLVYLLERARRGRVRWKDE